MTLKGFSKIWLTPILFFCVTAYSQDFRAYEKNAVQALHYGDDPIFRLALSLGRASEALTIEDAKIIFERGNHNGVLPKDLSQKWQKLLRMAQALALIERLPRFFPTGFEFETLYPNVNASENFRQGAEKFEDLIAGSFGLNSSRIHSESAYFTDEQSRRWGLVLELVRLTDGPPSGFELITPPIFQPEHLQQMSSFLWRLGQQRFGQSNEMTGGHQTFSLVPPGENVDSAFVARIAVNLFLLQAQFGPAFHEILNVKRMGGAAENIFFRPVAFDHHELLVKLSRWKEHSDIASLDLAKLRELLFDHFIEREFDIQVRNRFAEELIDEAEMKEMLGWPKEKKAGLRQVWKYRDTQVKINLENPSQTLFEVRIGDYVSRHPEKAILENYLYQSLINRAYEMAQAGELWSVDIPERAPNESAESFWDRYRLSPKSTPEYLFQTLGITNPQIANFILGRRFTLVQIPFRAYSAPTSGFEIEAYSEDITNVIIPRDPAFRKNWRRMNQAKRLQVLAELGFDLSKRYSEEKHRALTSEFMADTERFPFLSPELHLEASDNWEIKTHARGFTNNRDLERAIRQVARQIPEDSFGLHIHRFIPEAMLTQIQGPKAKEFVKFLERLSFYMQVKGYAESGYREPAHYLDSWSLDRFSPKDLSAILGHLNGSGQLGWMDQKYHNVGFRVVKGGIDLEIRDIGDHIGYGLEISNRIDNAVRTGNFGNIPFDEKSALFMEFRDHENLETVKQYTLEGALSKRVSLSAQERLILSKFQFEIYKPSMRYYFHFDEYSALDETPPQKMDTRFVRTNFENNLAIPLLNYEDQAFLSLEERQVLLASRERFLTSVHDLLKRVQQDPRYDFLQTESNFLYLADWLKNSTHSSRPDLKKVSKSVAKKQRKLLENLVFELRSFVVRFVRETRIDGMFERSLDSNNAPVIPLRPRPAGIGVGCRSLFGSASGF